MALSVTEMMYLSVRNWYWVIKSKNFMILTWYWVVIVFYPLTVESHFGDMLGITFPSFLQLKATEVHKGKSL